MRWCTLTPRLWPGNDRPFAMLAAQTAPGCERNCARPLPSSTAHTRLLSRVTDPPVQLPPPIRQPECKTTFQCLQTSRGNLLRLHTRSHFREGRSSISRTKCLEPSAVDWFSKWRETRAIYFRPTHILCQPVHFLWDNCVQLLP